MLARSSPNDKHTLVTRLNGKCVYVCMYVCCLLKIGLCVGLGHALPSTKEEWEALHPDKDFEKDKDLVLPGYAGQGCISFMYVCMNFVSLLCMYA